MEFSDHNSFYNIPIGSKFGQEVEGRQTRRALAELDANARRDHKRGLRREWKDELHGKNPRMDQANKPLTRRFGAELASTLPHLSPQEKKKEKTVSENNDVGDCIFVDRVPDCPPEPMFLESPKRSKPDNNEDEGNNQMEKVVMEDIINEGEEDDEEQIIDIDCNDKNDQLAAGEYVEDLYSYYWKNLFISIHTK